MASILDSLVGGRTSINLYLFHLWNSSWLIKAEPAFDYLSGSFSRLSFSLVLQPCQDLPLQHVVMVSRFSHLVGCFAPMSWSFWWSAHSLLAGLKSLGPLSGLLALLPGFQKSKIDARSQQSNLPGAMMDAGPSSSKDTAGTMSIYPIWSLYWVQLFSALHWSAFLHSPCLWGIRSGFWIELWEQIESDVTCLWGSSGTRVWMWQSQNGPLRISWSSNSHGRWCHYALMHCQSLLGSHHNQHILVTRFRYC